jgi:protein-S-isoprenylcysteine O-methyltransferase Ste14
LFSILIYVYVNFFEKSFPSCLALKNKKHLQGIYNYIRHPSYYIFFSITFGTSFCLSSLKLFIIALINHIFLYFYYMIEENQIKKENFYYAEYLKKTKRFFPRFSKIKP